jgi:hypothetical protein
MIQFLAEARGISLLQNIQCIHYGQYCWHWIVAMNIKQC